MQNQNQNFRGLQQLLSLFAPAKTKPASAPATVSGKTLTMRATAYTAYCEGCSGITANGTDIRSNPNLKVIAVDPRVIPLGTKVWVEGYGEAIAADTGELLKEIKSMYLFLLKDKHFSGVSKQ